MDSVREDKKNLSVFFSDRTTELGRVKPPEPLKKKNEQYKPRGAGGGIRNLVVRPLKSLFIFVCVFLYPGIILACSKCI